MQLACMPSVLCQKEQSAAPPAIVPSKYGLVSMTFLTVCEAASRTHRYIFITKRNSIAAKSRKGLTDVCPHAGSGIYCHNNSSLEQKAKSGGAVGWLHAFHCLSLERFQLQKCGDVHVRICTTKQQQHSQLVLLTSWTCGNSKEFVAASMPCERSLGS